ncbi:MAG TPA: hypothetical protein PLS12_11475, partial [Bacteroidales bacterium]|nr:hypothetical protein [Bacteroidales bacterium]
YVVRVLNGCSSDTVPVTLKVIKQPSFSIDSTNILRCANEQSQILQAKNLNQNYHTDNTITGEVRWYQGKVTTKGDSFTPDITKLAVGKEGNMIYAQYFVTAQGKTCASEQQSVRYEIRKLPDAAILTKMPICIGEYVNKSDAEVKIPIFARSNYVEWSSSSLFNGNTQYTRNIVLTADQLQELGVGYIPLTVKTIDRDRAECFTILKDSIKVSPMPNSKIIGSDKVCEYAVGEFYSIQQGSSENNYDWNVTGTSVLYSKDMTSGAVRYIDWDKPGIDTITVLVTSPDFCISQDTMVVYVAKSPQPQFDWELPGAMNISEFTNKTIQDSIVDKTPKGTTIAIEVPYTMYWDFGRSYNPEGKVVEYADRKEVVREEYMYGPHQVTLTVENTHGCLSSITKEIFVDIKSG